jgi:aldose 1-epimerase
VGWPLEIGSDEVEVEVLPEIGGRLHRLRAFGHDLLRTPDDVSAYRREPFFWGSFVMAPWCNRLDVGRLRVGDATVDLPANFADGTAIHGQVQALPWEVAEPGVLRVRAGGGGWPWAYDVRQSITVERSSLHTTLELTNRSPAAMPGGIGMHPWFVRPLQVAFAAGVVFDSNQANQSQPEPISGPFDLRRLAEMPSDLDATWGALRGPEAAQLRWPSLGIDGALRVSAEGGYLCAASPATLDAVAIEPQTHAPDGLRRLLDDQPGGLQLLAPGAALRLEVELAFRRTREI